MSNVRVTIYSLDMIGMINKQIGVVKFRRGSFHPLV